MKIAPFGVEIWMNQHETRCRYNLAETCTESLTIEELLSVSDARESLLDELLPMKLTYGAIEGSKRLRRAISQLYDHQSLDNVIVTHGAAGANALVHQTLVDPGDHVVTVVPAYQQHYSIPESLGARVDTVALDENRGYQLDPEKLSAAVQPETKLICLTNPNNPTGSLLDEHDLRAVVAVADRVGAHVLCDEVYRGTDDAEPGTTASIADLYDKGISTSSMSKAFSLAGLRLGWIVAAPQVINAVAIHRDYNTISVSMVDDLLSCLALEHANKILARTRRISREQRDIVDSWVAGESRISWIRPRGGTTALLRYDADTPSYDFCTGLLEEEGVLLTPGSAMGVEGTLRIGYAGNRRELEDGLPKISTYLHR